MANLIPFSGAEEVRKRPRSTVRYRRMPTPPTSRQSSLLEAIFQGQKNGDTLEIIAQKLGIPKSRVDHALEQWLFRGGSS